MMTAVIALSLLSCDDLYDSPDTSTLIPNSEQRYEYINATSYFHWIYINLHSKTVEDTVTLGFYDTEHIPTSWDIALRHYDIKTNDATVKETEYRNLSDFKRDVENGAFRKPQPSEMIPDNLNDSVIYDMSTMLEGYVGYAPTRVNRELGKWLDLNLSTMPPIYTPSGRVYLLEMKDGTMAAIHFTGFSNPNIYNTKGYISFEYLYPVNFR